MNHLYTMQTPDLAYCLSCPTNSTSAVTLTGHLLFRTMSALLRRLKVRDSRKYGDCLFNPALAAIITYMCAISELIVSSFIAVRSQVNVQICCRLLTVFDTKIAVTTTLQTLQPVCVGRTRQLQQEKRRKAPRLRILTRCDNQ